MSRGFRLATLIGVTTMALLAAWRLVHAIRLDAAIGRGDLQAALAIAPHDRDALIGLAERQMASGDIESAAGNARTALRSTPVDGRAYRILAQAAEHRGDGRTALALYRQAAAWAPRDAHARAWLAQYALNQRDYTGALRQIDRVLALSPNAAQGLLPVLADLAADPAFADALADMLRTNPSWRAAMLATLHQPKRDPKVGDRVLSTLQRKGGLAQDEFDAWIDGLLAQGRWGEAQARWASPLIATGAPLPLVFNGDFSRTPSGHGFDWRLPRMVGALVELESAGEQGNHLHARFLGRRIAGELASHPVLLPPGRYLMQWRERADAISADPGLEWRIECAQPGEPQPLARSRPIRGSFAWRKAQLEFVVPAQGCGAQWLRLGMAGASGAGQVADGSLWVSAVSIEAAAPPP